MANGVQVKQAPGAVLISGIASQPKALQLCERFAKQGIKSAIGMLPGVSGYQVCVYASAIEAVQGLLGQWGVELQDDQIT